MLQSYNNLTYGEVLEIMSKHPLEFNEFMKDAIKDYDTIFWECIPITYNTLNRKFQFVIIDSPQLKYVQFDETAFLKYFKNNNNLAVQFPNINGDAWLISPRPVSCKDFSSLARFIRNASTEYISSFWSCVSNTLKSKLLSNRDKKYWLSTSGLGISCLHVRIDDYPKYYNCNLLKEM